MSRARAGAWTAVLAVIMLSGQLVSATIDAQAAVAAEPSPARLAIGDSVMLGARWALTKQGFTVDAVKSRQATSGPALLARRGTKLASEIVVHLGTNGTFPARTCDAIVRAAGPSRHVYLVTLKVPRSWERANNTMIRACARRHGSGRVSVIDWRAQAVAHPEWLYADGIHLRPAGARAFTRLIDRTVDATVRSRTTSPVGL